jgi:hypothetical protein
MVTMKQLSALTLLILFCAANASAATVTVLGKRQFSIPVPAGWKSEQMIGGQNKFDTIVLDDPAGTIKLAFTFIPDAENHYGTKEQTSALMGDALGELLAGAVERKLSFTVVDAPGGFEAHSFFTDKKLVGINPVPKDEWRFITAGVRTFKGAFIFFTLLSNETDSAARTKALEIVTKELTEVSAAK